MEEQKIINVITDFTAEQIVESTADSVRIEVTVKRPLVSGTKYLNADGKETTIEADGFEYEKLETTTVGELKQALENKNSEIQITTSRLEAQTNEAKEIQTKIDEYTVKVDKVIGDKLAEPVIEEII